MSQLIYGGDFGTGNIKLFNIKNGEIINEKNIIAIKNKNTIFEFGDYAFEMYEKAPDNIRVSFPVKSGVIADFNNMASLFKCFYRKINRGKNITGADFCIAVPTDITEVEKSAFYDVILDSGIKARRIHIVEKSIADAIGVGIDINCPKGNMIVNIGADTTEISVISTGGMVLSKLIKTGGNRFDEAICSIVRRQYNLMIGMRTAERIKMALADALYDGKPENNLTYKAYGRNIVTGLPVSCAITTELVSEAMLELINSIVDNIKSILERTPPELSADIIDTGIYVTGGSGMIRNFDKLLSVETGLIINLVKDPSESVIRGIAEIVSNPRYAELMYIPKGKQYK